MTRTTRRWEGGCARHRRGWSVRDWSCCALGLLASAGGTAAHAADAPAIADVELGLGGAYRLGCWAPLRLSLRGGGTPQRVTPLAIALDSDGVPVVTTTPDGLPIELGPDQARDQTLYVRIGQRGAGVRSQLVAGGRVVAERALAVDASRVDGAGVSEGTPATDLLLLELGPGDAPMLAGVVRDDSTHRAAVSDPAQLPTDAIGYDSFHAVLLNAGPDPAGWLHGVSRDDPRVRALVDWVQRGGRLILSCGAAAEATLGRAGPLRELVPGDLSGAGALADAAAIERFTEPPEGTPRLDLRGATLPIGSVREPRGVVEAFAGRDSTESPLVIRATLGFGEVVFVAFDLDAPALASWEGTPTLLRRLLGPVLGRGSAADGAEDLANTLVERLDGGFAGVGSAPFLAIVGLVVLYLLLIGPGDYLFVKHALRRVEATWVTFPLLVAATAGAAYAAAHWLKGDALRVNQLEVIDLECATGRVRGSLVTHLFSPRATRYDLALDPRSLAGDALADGRGWSAWLGKPGWGLGGMQTSAAPGAGARPADYRLTPVAIAPGAGQTAGVVGLPVPIWSTKTLLSRYAGRTDRVIDSQLAPDRDGLVEGSITNDTGVKLTDCRLLYGAWAWRLGALGDGESVAIDPSVQPIKLTTLLKQSGAQASQSNAPGVAGLVAVATTAGRVAEGSAGTGRYLPDLELTHRLDAGDALLLASVEGPVNSLRTPDESADAPQRNSRVVARFVLPVAKAGP